MPKVVDHEARRGELVTAALALVAEGGLAAASVRAIANQTGWSAGAVRHYLPTAASLEGLLLDHVVERVQQRVNAQAAAGLAARLPRPELVARMLEQILPLDDDRRTEHRIWIALYVADPARAAELGWVWLGQRMFYRQLISLLDGASSVPDHPPSLPDDAERRAAFLHAYADGLALRIASGTEPAADSRTELRAFLTQIAAHTS